MADFFDQYYLWIKSFHIIFVTFWMAGMFYLPRLFVYHASADPGSELDKTLALMEKKLMAFIIRPTMILALFFGVLLLFVPNLISMADGWLHVKLFCVLLLLIFHAILSRSRKKFAANRNTKTGKYYRILNEIPPLLFVVIILMVVLKPF